MSAACPWLSGLLAFAACSAPPAAPDAPRDSVGAAALLRSRDAHALAPGNVIALVLPSADAQAPDRVALAMRAQAPPDVVMQVLRAVEQYPEVVGQVKRVEILQRDAHAVTFTLELDVPLQNLEYGLRYDLAHADRIEVAGVSGALAGGRFAWEVDADGAGSIVTYTAHAALSDQSGLLLNAVLRIHPDMQEGLMFAQGLRFLRAICAAAEQRAGMPGGAADG